MMPSFRYQLMVLFSLLLVFICVAHGSQVSAEEQRNYEDGHARDQPTAAARHRLLQQVLSRRGLYDPAFGDSWSNYFEKKRELFDPAYSDWANSFKRSDQKASN